MSDLTFNRRQILKFLGAGAALFVLKAACARALLPSRGASRAVPLALTPVRLPHPLPIYERMASFLATGLGTGESLRPAPGARLDAYTVIDDVVVPPEYERYVIVHWGDRVFPNADDYVGYNADYTAFIPIRGRDDDGFLWVNHEYVSYPISSIAPAIAVGLNGRPTTDLAVLGFSLPTGASLASLTPADRRLLLGEFSYNQGGSAIRIVRANHKARFEVVRDPKNRRLHGLSGLALNAERTDGYQAVIAWGGAPRQQGDLNYVLATGRAAREVFPRSSDGLGARIIGTAFNCSGATTPWQTVLSAEENFQGSSGSYMGVQENVLPNGTQTDYVAGTSGQEFGLVGEKYGWMVEIDPAVRGHRPRKHTALGRFRHENITLWARPQRRLVAYMGDDRRGGHTWKFVSRSVLTDPQDKRNSRLLHKGTLFVARFHPDGTGRWIPLDLTTPIDPVVPSVLGSAELAALGSISRNGNTSLPKRNGVAGQTADGGPLTVTIQGITGPIVLTESEVITSYKTKGGTKPEGRVTLADYYTSQGAVLCDAFLAANLVGGTPCARPEDFEVNPRRHREVLLAMTDGAPGSDGYPDSRIFQVSKTTSAVNGTQQSGGLYKIIEDRAADGSLSFHWERLEQGGEVGATQGSGFAALDNLAFDKRGNVFGVTDMSTGLHNGFTEGFPNNPTTVDHTATGDVANLVGVFGNNWLFYIPTEGPEAGEIIPLAYGPTRCEMTGPTVVRNTLILAVQHPSEDCIFDQTVEPAGALLNRPIELLDLTGQVFTQNRTLSRGSNWPSNIEGNLNGPPRPCVIAIQRKDSEDRFI